MARTSKEPASFLPLKPVDLHVLMVLLDGELHGYGIVQAITERTQGQIRLVPGNFYAILKRLLESGLLADAGERPSADPGKPARRCYAITSLGKRVVAAEAIRLQRIVREAESRRLIKPAKG